MFSIIIYFENNLHFINKEDILDKKEVNKRFDNNSDSGYLYNAILKNDVIGCYQDKIVNLFIVIMSKILELY